MSIRLLAILVVFMSIASCISKKEPLQYLNDCSQDDEYVKKIKTTDYTILCYYRSPEYLALKELVTAKDLPVNRENYEAQIKKFEQGLYFDLRIMLNNGENTLTYGLKEQNDYAIRVDYINNAIKNDFRLIPGQHDENAIYPILHSFYNSYGAGKSCDLTLVFSRKKIDESEGFSLEYTDKVFNIKQKVSFHFDKKIIQKQPQIKFD